ncbi:50S ribosomal protein L24 [Candidatus Shapirobacteria bacterium CG_4_9_14_0_2_um_filter_39_11]|uniref:Large ribosomal subunit protein uL24 n=1 Tax=Candidatus Shapirobacteria bacterium CG_4_9_14_0_2_um_filter_39_11 TaxID=1974478 RepID=A0A2M8ET95_9BACT|nr:MAG: 50S ribosomal protein L24 [Candidatus Shapirobacteria bacterium CG_4_9_14_0_2_um_filter_39_11]
MKLKKGDNIIVIAGKDKGRKGKIEKIFPKEGLVLLPGINVFKRHTKSRGEKQPGGIIDIIKPLPISNVALLCPKCGKPTRVGYRVSKDGTKSRICRKCQAII